MSSLFSTSEALAARRGKYKRVGFFLSFLGDPYPAQLGYNLAFNTTRATRVVVNYSYASSTSLVVHSFGTGMKFLVPSWVISPVLGINYTRVISNKTFTYQPAIGTNTVGPFNNGMNHFYVNIGVEWRAPLGYYLGAGMDWSFHGKGYQFYWNFGTFFF